MEMSSAEKVRGLLEVNNSSYDIHLVYIYMISVCRRIGEKRGILAVKLRPNHFVESDKKEMDQ